MRSPSPAIFPRHRQTVAPTFYRGGAQVVYGNANWSDRHSGHHWSGIHGRCANGRSPSMAAASLPARSGRQGRKSRCMGQSPSSSSSSRAKPTRWARASASSNVPFTVVGVLARKGRRYAGRPGPGRYRCFVPLSTYQASACWAISGHPLKRVGAGHQWSRSSEAGQMGEAARDRQHPRAAAPAPSPASRATTRTISPSVT